MVLCNRLNLWFRPFCEQAGAQSKHVCIEHIVALRLLMNVARRERHKLFLTFVDSNKAYDMVPLDRLFVILKRIGYGMLMLAAFITKYSVTESVIGGSVMTATMGVRQGSPTSFLLSMFYSSAVAYQAISYTLQETASDPFIIFTLE